MVTQIQQGMPGLSPVAAAHLYETFEVCMHLCGHEERVPLRMEGTCGEEIMLHWHDGFDTQKERTHADLTYATEHGAVCLSIMLVVRLTSYTIVERSRKGTGIDYWLGEKDSLLFQRKARLEVSGILNGDEHALRRRHREKVEQIENSDGTMLSAYLSVVEFGTPMALFTKRDKS